MLTLSRKVGEAIQIGPDIRVVLLSVARGKVRLGIDAPRQVPVFREELLTQPTSLPVPQGESPPDNYHPEE
jgi:carbon storage regulator